MRFKSLITVVCTNALLLLTACQAIEAPQTTMSTITPIDQTIVFDSNGISYTQSEWDNLDCFDQSNIQTILDALQNYRDASNRRDNGSNALQDLYGFITDYTNEMDVTIEIDEQAIDAYDVDHAYLSYTDHYGKSNRIDGSTIVSSVSIDDATTYPLVYVGQGKISDIHTIDSFASTMVLLDVYSTDLSALPYTLQQLQQGGAMGMILIDHSDGLTTSFHGYQYDVPIMVIDQNQGESLKNELLLNDGLTINMDITQSIDQSTMQSIAITVNGRQYHDDIVIPIALDCMDDIDVIDTAIAYGLDWLDHMVQNPLNHDVTFIFYSGKYFSKVNEYYDQYRGLMSALNLIDDCFMVLPLYGNGQTIDATQEYQGILSDLIESYNNLMDTNYSVNINTSLNTALSMTQNQGLSGLMVQGNTVLDGPTMHLMNFIVTSMDHYSIMPMDFSYRFETILSELESDAILELSGGDVNGYRNTLNEVIMTAQQLDQWIIDHQFTSVDGINDQLRKLNEYIQSTMVRSSFSGLSHPVLIAQNDLVALSDCMLALQANDLETAKQDLYRIGDNALAVESDRTVWMMLHQRNSDDVLMRNYRAWFEPSMDLYDLLWMIIDGQTNASDISNELITLGDPYSESASAKLADALQSSMISMEHIIDMVESMSLGD